MTFRKLRPDLDRYPRLLKVAIFYRSDVDVGRYLSSTPSFSDLGPGEIVFERGMPRINRQLTHTHPARCCITPIKYAPAVPK